jgi:adenylate cyclase
LASRIEGQTKYYGITIAIGSSVAARLPGFALIEIDRLRVVGRDRPETLFALLGDAATAASPGFAALATAQAAMLAAYRAQDWDAAAARHAEVLATGAPFHLGTLAALYADRIAACRANPPGAGWDGVFQATEK